jgi:hypothetical protein
MIFKVNILPPNNDGMCGVCMLQMSGYRGASRRSKPMLAIYIGTPGLIRNHTSYTDSRN